MTAASQAANGASAALPLFASFWQGGYEGADHVNGFGLPLSMLGQTRHLEHLEEDYAALAAFGIGTVRESAGWRSCERDGGFDFASVVRRADAARRHGLQICWTCCHYGMPEDVDVFGTHFVDRFERYCKALAAALVPFHADAALAPVFTPINEISFFAWAICETGLMHPHRGDRATQAYELKMQLVSAALAGARAIRAVSPHARFLHVDPLVHVIAPHDRPDLESAARASHENQFQAWDMLCGKKEPQLGGSRELLDAIGLNYYHSNQWEFSTDRRLHWHLRDARRRPFARLLGDVAARYGAPISVAETSHVGDGRGRWIEEVAREIAAAAAQGVRVEGLCLYPLVDRPDWEHPSRWHCSGLWDVDTRDAALPRRLNAAYAASLKRAQRSLRADTDERIEQDKVPIMKTLIVFSHLRWDFVFQRPQHLLTRLAAHWQILFVEEPMHDSDTECAELTTPAPNVTVLRPHTRLQSRGFHDEQMPVIGEMLRAHLRDEGITEYAVWFYTPMALPLLGGLEPQAIVYDCMDELGAFKFAPPQLLSREATLLRIANAVFTGGPSLYEAKRHRHANAHCFPSSVDVAHFGRGREARLAHPELASLPRPRLGFFGVIDERLDVELVAEMARRRPNWQICLVGPIVKIDPAVLPRYPNIHYLPQQPYDALPAFLAGWDVCLLPFAHNESTRYISPTKTLEYLAADKPVVSVDIADVVSLYGDGVWLAHDADAFIAACDDALRGVDEARLATMRGLVAATSWDRTAARMAELVDEACACGLNTEAKSYLHGDQVMAMPARGRGASKAECLILGAGPTGLSAAYHYGAGSVLVERNDSVGGWCRSIEDGGYTFDYAGHIMFSNDPDVLALYQVLLGTNVHWQNREAWIYSKNVHTRYPFQGALYGLPSDVLKECLVGAIEARFGALDGKAAAPAPASKPLLDCCADGTAGDVPAKEHSDLAGSVRSANDGSAAPANFEEFIHRVWGAGVAKHFAIPYNRKLWTVPLADMETSWLGGRVPMPNLEEMIDGALKPVPAPMGPNARFGYPLRGGFQALMDGFLPHLKGELMLDAEVAQVLPSQHRVILSDGRRLDYERLLSTLPLPKLIAAIGSEAPAEIHAAAAALRHISVRCVNLGIGRSEISDKHWIYYPEDTVFHRIFLQGNASPHCNAPGGFALTCEISYSPTKALRATGAELIRMCIEDCKRVGIIDPDDPVPVANEVDMPYAYVLYDHARAANVTLIRQWLAERDILLAGRYSEWEYYNSDHAFVAGKRAAATLRELRAAPAAASMAG